MLAAPFVGSFLGVLILRLPDGRPVALARSACEQCGTRLAALELVPLLSYALQRGRAGIAGRRSHRFIGRSSSRRRQWRFRLRPWRLVGRERPAWLWVNCGFGWALLALAWIDWDSMLLPDALTLPLIPAGLLATLWLEPELATDHALAAAVGYTALRGLALVYRRVRGRDGLGEGDAKLLAALGAWVGLEPAAGGAGGGAGRAGGGGDHGAARAGDGGDDGDPVRAVPGAGGVGGPACSRSRRRRGRRPRRA